MGGSASGLRKETKRKDAQIKYRADLENSFLSSGEKRLVKQNRRNIQSAVSYMRNMRMYMQDEHICMPSLGTLNHPHLSYFAVFDGHGGKYGSHASLFARDQLLLHILGQEDCDRNNEPISHGDLESALQKGFVSFDEYLSALTENVLLAHSLTRHLRHDETANSKNPMKINQKTNKRRSPKKEDENQDVNGDITLWSSSCLCSTAVPLTLNLHFCGTTACVFFITPTHFVVANLGDSRMVLARSNSEHVKVHFSTKDHKPNSETELQRITDAGAFVDANRVMGELAVSRAFGDFYYKSIESLDQDKQPVCSSPDISVIERHDDDHFIILGSDGLWDVFSNEDAVHFIRERLAEGVKLEKVTEMLLDEASFRGSNDNITVILVLVDEKHNAISPMSLSKIRSERYRARREEELAVPGGSSDEKSGEPNSEQKSDTHQ